MIKLLVGLILGLLVSHAISQTTIPQQPYGKIRTWNGTGSPPSVGYQDTVNLAMVQPATWNLPSCPYQGFQFAIKDTATTVSTSDATNPLTLNPPTGKTIEGQTSWSMQATIIATGYPPILDRVVLYCDAKNGNYWLR